MNIDDNTTKILLIIGVALVTYFLIKNNTEGYQRVVGGGEYGKPQNEIYWYPYPNTPHPGLHSPGTRHVKYDPLDKVHSVSYIYPDNNTTVNEPHNCDEIGCGNAFKNEDVKCYKCPQLKAYDSGR